MGKSIKGNVAVAMTEEGKRRFYEAVVECQEHGITWEDMFMDISSVKGTSTSCSNIMFVHSIHSDKCDDDRRSLSKIMGQVVVGAMLEDIDFGRVKNPMGLLRASIGIGLLPDEMVDFLRKNGLDV